MQNYAFEFDPFFKHFRNSEIFQKCFKNILKHYKNGTLFTLFKTHFNAFRKRYIHDSVGLSYITKDQTIRNNYHINNVYKI